MSLHLVIEDNTPDPQVPEPGACRFCGGEQTLPVIKMRGNTVALDKLLPCQFCCCAVCGDTTETAPLCRDCDERQNRD